MSQHGRIGQGRLQGEAVAEVVKAAVKTIGKDPTRYGGHSLRAGLATAAAMAGVPEMEISRQGRQTVVVHAEV